MEIIYRSSIIIHPLTSGSRFKGGPNDAYSEPDKDECPMQKSVTLTRIEPSHCILRFKSTCGIHALQNFLDAQSSTSIPVSKMRGIVAAATLLLCVVALWSSAEASKHEKHYCYATSDAIAALQSDANVSVHHIPGTGFAFHGLLDSSRLYAGKAIVIIPDHDVAPQAYAPLARALALFGSDAVVVDKPRAKVALRAMMQYPRVEEWTLAGHGHHGGALAARMALTLHPKVTALVLMAAPLPRDVDMADLNLLVVALYGHKDSVVTPMAVEASFERFPGDSYVTSFPNLGHYDFARSECTGNNRSSEEEGHDQVDVTSDFDNIVSLASSAVGLSRWMGATEKALSFSDNEKLKPGHNDSKPYPGDIRVHYSKIPMPDTSPQRYWHVFTPGSEMRGGYVYYPGAAVDARAYFPMAFQIAARGHLVVIVQMPMRTASFRYQDANAVIASNHPLLSVVPKGKWALGGHSAGGYAATQYAGEYSDNIYAIAMHAGGWGSNLTQNSLPIKQIYGTLDGISPGGFDRYRYRYTEPPPEGNGPLVNLNSTVFLPVEGANHCQSGDYGYQSFDGIATISMEHQVRTFAQETVSFLDHVLSGKPIAQHRPVPVEST